MLNGPPKQDRKVVPRWRLLESTPAAEFLRQTTAPLIQHGGLDQLKRLRNSWNQEKSISLASEILPLAILLHVDPLASEASALIAQQERVPVLLRRHARETLSSSATDEIETGEPAIGLPFYRARIALAKKQLAVYPRDALLHVDVARLYASIGQMKSAEQHLQIALILAPHDRFVLRSSVRYYVHAGQPDRALSLLRSAPRDDPWILASQVALADMAGSRDIWSSQARVALARQHHPSQTTELAASLATLEAKSGARRRANKLFRAAALFPNDNAVAQLHWAHEAKLTGFNEQWLLVKRSYEARAGHAFFSDRWQDAITNCELWLRDEPFSARPALLGGFIASEFLKDHGQAIRFVEAALLANPENATLHNNHAFSLASLDRLEEAGEALNRASQLTEKSWSDPILTATRGLILFRQGDTDTGRRLYQEAIKGAVIDKAGSTAELALIHWLNEEIRSGMTGKDELVSTLHNYFSDREREASIPAKVFRSLVAEPLAQTISDLGSPEIEAKVTEAVGQLRVLN